MTETFPLRSGKNTSELADAIMNFFTADKHMEAQKLTDAQGATIVQARISGGKWKQLVGMDKAIAVKLIGGNQSVIVEIGGAKWADKATVMVISMFVLWPLTVTSGIGMYQQGKLKNEIKDVITRYLLA